MPERTCPNCGDGFEDAKFCPECGERLLEPPEEAAEASVAPPPPPPPEEPPVVRRTEGLDATEPPGVVGAELSGSDLPAGEPPASPEPSPPEAEDVAEPPEAADDAAVTPESLDPRGSHQEPVVAGATPMQQAAEDARAPTPPMDGQLRCPGCAEAVYESDRVCWSCSRSLDVHEAPEDVAPEQGGPPESGAPVERAAPPRPAPGQGGRIAERPEQRGAAEPSDQVRAYAWWAFGLGLLSVFTCGILGLLGFVALWLGISAARRNAGPVAIAGAVFGAIGLLMLLAWAIGLAIVMPEMTGPRPSHIILPSFM